MTVAELKAALSKYPDDMQVFVYDGEWGQQEIHFSNSLEKFSYMGSISWQEYLTKNPGHRLTDERYPERLFIEG